MNKIQKYILTHYPIIWNIRLVPMLFLTLIMHILFYLIGYIFGNTDFNEIISYYHSSVYYSIYLPLLYLLSIITATLILISWFVFYMRNNRIANYYPAKTKQMYGEWILIFIIIGSAVFIPYSLRLGLSDRALYIINLNKADENKVIKTLQMTEVLIPNDIKPAIRCNIDSLKHYANDSDSAKLSVSQTPSLLNYSDDSSYMYYEINNKNRNENILKVKQWLRDGQTDSIRALMNDFYQLLLKHNLVEDNTLKPDQWFERIYNPPYFNINHNNIILRDSSEIDYKIDYNAVRKEIYLPGTFSTDTIYVGNQENIDDYVLNIYPVLQFNNLRDMYNRIITCTKDFKSRSEVPLLLFITVLISIFILSIRLTNTASWFKAFIICGIAFLSLTFMDLILIFDSGYHFILVPLFGLILTITTVTNLCYKIMFSRSKGFSNVTANIFLWFIPLIILIIYFLLSILIDETRYSYIHENEYVMLLEKNLLWINLAFTIVIMYPVMAFLRRWKGLPDE